MKESKNNYPNFYLAPLQVLSSLIEIGNTFLKGNKKMTEEIFTAGLKKHAKSIEIRNDKMKSPTKGNPNTIVEKNVISKKNLEKNIGKKVDTLAINKSSIVVKKKAIIPLANKAKSIVKKKIVSPTANKAKSIKKKKIGSSAKNSTKSLTEKKLKTPIKKKTKSIVKEIKKEFPKVKIHGEDLHFIHGKGENHPRTTLEVHKAENVFHHQEEVALHQENKKVKDAMPSRKTFKGFNRSQGQR